MDLGLEHTEPENLKTCNLEVDDTLHVGIGHLEAYVYLRVKLSIFRRIYTYIHEHIYTCICVNTLEYISMQMCERI